MKTYIITFHTHLSAMMTERSLKSKGITDVRLMPVPRSVSSSCGTCLRFSGMDYCPECIDEDAEGIYEEKEGRYILLLSFDE